MVWAVVLEIDCEIAPCSLFYSLTAAEDAGTAKLFLIACAAGYVTLFRLLFQPEETVIKISLLLVYWLGSYEGLRQAVQHHVSPPYCACVCALQPPFTALLHAPVPQDSFYGAKSPVIEKESPTIGDYIFKKS